MKTFKLNTLAISVAAFIAAPASFAQDTSPPPLDSGITGNLSLTETVDIKLTNQADVHLVKKAMTRKIVNIEGDIAATGTIEVTGAALSIIDDKQISADNEVMNKTVRNTAAIDAGAGTDASGNIGVNVAAGDGNLQDNATALAAADLATVLGSADAEAFTAQLGGFNVVTNTDVVNDAKISDGAFNGASGVVALNVTAGNFNMQKNNTSAAVSTGVMAETNIWVKQESVGMYTDNQGTVQVTEGKTLPDPFGQGYVDEDSYIEGTSTVIPVSNTAMLSNALVGATGNLGVNIAAGTNNYQNNSLAISATSLDVTNFSGSGTP